MKPAALFWAAIAVGSSLADAHASTAVCTGASGRIFGVHGSYMKNTPFDERDSISGATFTIIWNRGKGATIVSQSSGGGPPETVSAVEVFDTDEQVSFVVPYTSVVWMYSIYPKARKLIMTAHNNGMSIDSGGAVVKSFIASCAITE